jgi:hypothetical protein
MLTSLGELMIKGYAQRRVDRDAWEIALFESFSNERTLVYTFEFKSHIIDASCIFPTTIIENSDHGTKPLIALSKAMQEMGIMQDDATSAELKATKYHLEDFRKLVFKIKENK